MDINPFTLQFSGKLEQDFLNYYYKISLKHGRIGLLTTIFLFSIFGILDELNSSPAAIFQLRLIRYGVVTPLLMAIFVFSFSTYFKKIIQEIFSVSVFLSGFTLLTMGIIHSLNLHESLSNESHITLMLALMYAYTFVTLRFIYGSLVSWALVACYNLVAVWVLNLPLQVLFKNDFYLLAANFIGMFASYQIEMYIRKNFIQTSLLQAEQEKSERLLMNILPQSIAKRLKQEQIAIADSFAEVTVLFADIAGFTNLATQVSPTELVNLLNQIFSAFDELVDRHGLEKIKTIGDAYMVVGGLPDPRPDHAEAIAEMALDILDRISYFKPFGEEPFTIRIGINTGPVVAGVIGIKKFIYDLWGDTVNTASRMESHGIPGSIQVTSATYERLQHKYIFQERGMISVKGKGAMMTYLLIGRKVQPQTQDFQVIR